MADDSVQAEQAANAWLAMTDRDDADGSWHAASSLFQRAITPEQWSRALSAARGPLGALVQRALADAKPATELPGAPDGEYVVITYHSSFAHKRSATETVTPMREHDGLWRVSGYVIR
jgi:hypothetical protein